MCILYLCFTRFNTERTSWFNLDELQSQNWSCIPLIVFLRSIQCAATITLNSTVECLAAHAALYDMIRLFKLFDVWTKEIHLWWTFPVRDTRKFLTRISLHCYICVQHLVLNNNLNHAQHTPRYCVFTPLNTFDTVFSRREPGQWKPSKILVFLYFVVTNNITYYL